VTDGPLSVTRLEARAVTETPYGSVGVLCSSPDLKAWWIRKEDEEIDPEWKVHSRDDLLYVVSGRLKLELRGSAALVLEAGDVFVIPAATAFRGYRWPRDSDEPCLFLAVAPGALETTSEPVE
jgi:mannose-6-phosphate isomerase-like protein (cupin superfamily)